MGWIPVILGIIGFMSTAFPKVMEFIRIMVDKFQALIDDLKKDYDENVAKEIAREHIVSETKKQFPDTPEPLIRMTVEAEVLYRKYGKRYEVELAKKTYPELFGMKR